MDVSSRILDLSAQDFHIPGRLELFKIGGAENRPNFDGSASRRDGERAS
jgi:hypothetical protein